MEVFKGTRSLNWSSPTCDWPSCGSRRSLGCSFIWDVRLDCDSKLTWHPLKSPRCRSCTREVWKSFICRKMWKLPLGHKSPPAETPGLCLTASYKVYIWRAKSAPIYQQYFFFLRNLIEMNGTPHWTVGVFCTLLSQNALCFTARTEVPSVDKTNFHIIQSQTTKPMWT